MELGLEKSLLQIFMEADRDFYKIDHNLFAPACADD
jgi:methenyltetrahydromethanopterin cyclohydrolase